jgi:predicted small lipoprotein YifL
VRGRLNGRGFSKFVSLLKQSLQPIRLLRYPLTPTLSPGRGAGVKIALALTLAFSLSACGVKSDLLRPDGKPTPKTQHDPSRPPQPIGQ